MHKKTFPLPNAIEVYREEVSLARLELARCAYKVCFPHLERAHVVSQHMTGRHIYVRCLMLVAGLGQADYHEVLGQIPRILASLLFSRLWVPRGNTGRARANALQQMPVPEDLRHLFL
jgi:hypothetical protein